MADDFNRHFVLESELPEDRESFPRAYAMWTAAKHAFAVLGVTGPAMTDKVFGTEVEAAAGNLHRAFAAVANAPARGRANFEKKLGVLESALAGECIEMDDKFALVLLLSIKRDCCWHTIEVDL